MSNIPGKTIKLEIKPEGLLFFILFIFLAILMYLSKGSFTGGDTYNHYQIARYAFKHPYLLLDLWGKPLFTLLFAPFAQFDYDIAKLFNVFIGILTAYFSFLTVKKLQHKISFTVIFFVLFSPVYFIMLNSVMTEILFGFFLILAAYLLISGKLNMAALLLSFIPFIRSEGFILLPFFALFFFSKKQWIAMLLLCTGFLIYSLTGKFLYYHDFFWVITKNPYPFESDLYGNGSFWFFFKSYRLTWGDIQALLLIGGIVVLLIKLFTSKGEERNITKAEFNFIFVPAFIFFMFHVIAWWLGIFASDGEVRILAGITPLSAIIANKGLNFIISRLPDKKTLQNLLLILVCSAVIYAPFRLFKMPLQMDDQQRLIREASLFVKNNYPGNKVYYVDPLVSAITGRDPYENKLIQQWFINPEHPDIGLNNDDLVIWDAHFCPNEGNAPLKNFLNNSHFTVLKYLKPDIPFKVLGGYDYEVYIFQKKSETENISNNQNIYENGFEEKSTHSDSSNYSSLIKRSGNYSFQLDSTIIYSPGYNIDFAKIKDTEPFQIIASVMAYSMYKENQPPRVSLVISIDRAGKPYKYNSMALKNINFKPGVWNELKLTSSIPNDIKETDRIKVYAWHQGNMPVYVDDLKVQIKGIHSKRQ